MKAPCSGMRAQLMNEDLLRLEHAGGEAHLAALGVQFTFRDEGALKRAQLLADSVSAGDPARAVNDQK